LRAVLEWAAGQGVHLEASVGNLDEHEWQQAEIVYKREKQPFVVEASTDELVKRKSTSSSSYSKTQTSRPRSRRFLTT